MNTSVVIDVFRNSRRSGPVLNGSRPVLNGSGPVLNESGPPDGSGSVRIDPNRSKSILFGPMMFLINLLPVRTGPEWIRTGPEWIRTGPEWIRTGPE